MTHNPFVEVTKDTTTLYASDRDIFLFLVDDTHPIEAGRLPNGDPDLFFRGVYGRTSEERVPAQGAAAGAEWCGRCTRSRNRPRCRQGSKRYARKNRGTCQGGARRPQRRSCEQRSGEGPPCGTRLGAFTGQRGGRLKARLMGSVTLAGVPLSREDETMHVAAIGATGSGKSTALRALMADAIRRGDRQVVADPDGAAMSAFFEPGDVILNPFDRRCAHDQWITYAQQFLAAALENFGRLGLGTIRCSIPIPTKHGAGRR